MSVVTEINFDLELREEVRRKYKVRILIISENAYVTEKLEGDISTMLTCNKEKYEVKNYRSRTYPKLFLKV